MRYRHQPARPARQGQFTSYSGPCARCQAHVKIHSVYPFDRLCAQCQYPAGSESEREKRRRFERSVARGVDRAYSRRPRIA